METYKKFSVRAQSGTVDAVEAFAKGNGISRNAAVGILLKLGLQHLQSSDVNDEHFDALNKKLHDSLGNILTAQMYQFYVLEMSLSTETQAELLSKGKERAKEIMRGIFVEKSA